MLRSMLSAGRLGYRRFPCSLSAIRQLKLHHCGRRYASVEVTEPARDENVCDDVQAFGHIPDEPPPSSSIPPPPSIPLCRLTCAPERECFLDDGPLDYQEIAEAEAVEIMFDKRLGTIYQLSYPWREPGTIGDFDDGRQDLWSLVQRAVRSQMNVTEHKRRLKASEIIGRQWKSRRKLYDYDKKWTLDEGLRMIEECDVEEYLESTSATINGISTGPQLHEFMAPKKELQRFRVRLDDPRATFKVRGLYPPMNLMEYIKIFRRKCGSMPLTNEIIDQIANLPIQSYEMAVAVGMLRELKINSVTLKNCDLGHPILEQMMKRDGTGPSDIWEWTWILSGASDDESISRLVSLEKGFPFFIFYSLLRPSETNFLNRMSLPALLQAIQRSFITHIPPCNSSQVHWYLSNVAFIIQYMALHCRRLWPAFAPTCATMFVELLDAGLPRLIQNPKTIYAVRSAVINCLIQHFSRLADSEAFHNSIFNWQALRVLLSYSDQQKQPFMLDRYTYTSVRMVLLAMEHSPQERETCSHLTNTWPPYPEARDGIDELLTPEDNQSRVVRLGQMATEAGFPKDTLDIIIDTLGGMGPTGTPTIRTRTILSKLLRRRTLDIQDLWASQIRSTRNATEAWAIFNQPLRSTMTPGPSVYEAMFVKLVNRENTSPRIVPGEARELMPTWIANLTDFERARQEPPTVEQLYGHMQSNKVEVKPSCLCLLVKHASSVSDSRRYLEDAPNLISLEQVDALCAPMDATNLPIIKTIRRDIMAAYIRLLLKKHTKSHVDVHRYHSATFFRVQKAYWLAMARFTDKLDEGISVWRDICATLADTPTVRLHPHIDEKQNMAKLLPLFMRVFFHVVHNCGRDLEVASALYTVVECYMMPLVFENQNCSIKQPLQGPMMVFGPEQDPPPDLNIPDITDYNGLKEILLGRRTDGSELQRVWALRRFAGAFFKRITDKAGYGRDVGKFDVSGVYLVPSHAIHRLMRAWAFTGNFWDMAELVRWIAAEWDDGGLSGHIYAGVRERNSIMGALCAFRLFAEDFLPEEEVMEIQNMVERRVEREGGPTVAGFYWPRDREKELYGEGDLLGHAQILRRFLKRVGQQRRGGLEEEGERDKESDKVAEEMWWRERKM